LVWYLLWVFQSFSHFSCWGSCLLFLVCWMVFEIMKWYWILLNSSASIDMITFLFYQCGFSHWLIFICWTMLII
jgi:hypothetical protein